MQDSSFLDWPFLEDSHRAHVRDLRAWVEEVAPTVSHKSSHDDVDEACKTWVAKLGQGGWLEPPTSLSGKLDVRTLCLTRETLAFHDGLADFAFAMQGLGTGPISLFGTPEQKTHYLPPVSKGEKIAAFALSEAEAGSDVASLATTAELDSDSYILNGEKIWISNGGIADHYVVFARTGEREGAKGLSAFIVDADTTGCTVAERLEVMAPHPLGRIVFDNCRIPKENIIGKPGEGFKIAMATLDVFRSTVGAAALGFARRALHEALTYSSSRQLFGASLNAMQTVQSSLADMALEIDASALLIYRAAWTKDCVADRITKEAAMAKLYATEAAQRVIDAAVQLHGAKGVQSGQVVEKLYREIRALRIYEGASEVQKQVIARQMLRDMP